MNPHPKKTLTLLFGLWVTASVHSAVLPPNALVGNRTMADWSVDWWQWAFSVPVDHNPLFDTTGEWAGNGQTGKPVFFVAGILSISGTQTRSFTVPEGSYLFFPLINQWVDNVDIVPPFTVEQLREFNEASMQIISELHASVNGEPVPNLFDYRAIAPLFSIEYLVEDNIHTFLAGHPVLGIIDPIVADGYYLMLEPLTPGTHVINFGGTIGSPVNFTLDITATITVVSESPIEKITDLIEQVEGAGLSSQRKNALLASLIAARASFERDHLISGCNQLRAFQHKIGAQVTPMDATLAGELIEAARGIIDRVEELSCE